MLEEFLTPAFEEDNLDDMKFQYDAESPHFQKKVTEFLNS
jgi:hypothetical protein